MPIFSVSTKEDVANFNFCPKCGKKIEDLPEFCKENSHYENLRGCLGCNTLYVLNGNGNIQVVEGLNDYLSGG